MKSTLLVLLGLVLGIASSALALTKTANLIPPSDYTSPGWNITVYPLAPSGATTAANWCATTTFVAKDAVTGAQDNVNYTTCTTTPPAAVTTFVNGQLAAAKTANGY